ncbi:DNA photolyase family protein [Pelagibacteraceae bacterium]|nr:DNA photolyase family protein [Pelagibacteraceae bacterium]
MNNTCLLLFRKDLRLDDNPALLEAVKHENVIPLFVFDPSLDEYAKIGSTSHWWLERSLISLNKQLSGKLRVLLGNSYDLIFNICEEKKIKFVYWNRCYEPDRIIADTEIKSKLKDNNIKVKSFNSSLLWEPWSIKNKSGNFYKVFTPFYNRGCLEAEKPRTPLKAPKKNNFIKLEGKFRDYKFKYEESENKWYKKLEENWNPSESNARSSFEDFLKNGSDQYAEGRNFPSKKNVSRISAYLHWGQISPFRLWYDAKKNMKGVSLKTFLSELGWREFSYHLLYYFPDINNKNLKPKFNNLEWNNDNNLLDKWKKGKTGYPIVDAGMRELWQTGYMHNRLRMVTASFLIKNLLIHWKYGEQWFWECLVDADLASNSASWQWVAGTGSDAAPFFRIFNPMTQAQKFDKEGTYIRKFVPEIAKLPNRFIFNPWLADKQTLKDSNVQLGIDYPFPIIDYTLSRSRALEAFKKI